MIETYFAEVGRLLKKIENRQLEQMKEAANLIADVVLRDGLIYVYGSGHAHMSAEDLFYRAGGLANVYPIFIEPLMLHEAAVHSSKLEKEEGLLEAYLEPLGFGKNDIMIVVSSSGRNATPIDAALFAKRRGGRLITISSKEYSLSAPSGHSCKKRLMELGDVNLDNLAPVGDACLETEGLEAKFSPVSSITNLTILQAMIGESIKLCVEAGFTSVPVLKSGNMTGGAEYNQKIIEIYGKRIPYLM